MFESDHYLKRYHHDVFQFCTSGSLCLDGSLELVELSADDDSFGIENIRFADDTYSNDAAERSNVFGNVLPSGFRERVVHSLILQDFKSHLENILATFWEHLVQD